MALLGPLAVRLVEPLPAVRRFRPTVEPVAHLRIHVLYRRLIIGRRVQCLAVDGGNPIVGQRVRPRRRLRQRGHHLIRRPFNLLAVPLQACSLLVSASSPVARDQEEFLDPQPISLEDNRTRRLPRWHRRLARPRPRTLLPLQRAVDQGLEMTLLGPLAGRLAGPLPAVRRFRPTVEPVAHLRISVLWGIHLTGVRRVNWGDGSPRASARCFRVLNSPSPTIPARYPDLHRQRSTAESPANTALGAWAPAEPDAASSEPPVEEDGVGQLRLHGYPRASFRNGSASGAGSNASPKTAGTQ